LGILIKYNIHETGLKQHLYNIYSSKIE